MNYNIIIVFTGYGGFDTTSQKVLNSEIFSFLIKEVSSAFI